MTAIFKRKKNSAAGPTLAKSSTKLTTGFYLFLAFFVPFILMFFAFAVAGVSPFGKNQILVTDLWHQYYPFLVDYQDKLTSGGSLLWTWKSGGGTNYLALMAYYLASPLNFLSVLVPPQALREFLYVITCVKIGLSGLFFALFLKMTFKRRDVSIAAFGIMYALCAFIMGYYWNVIWLDTIALLPLVIAGTFALLREGKFRLYIITLALSVLANYYIGLFTCIFIVLVSVGYTIVEFKGWKAAVKDFFKMLGCSIVAVMFSAVLTLPAYFALGHTHSSDNTFPSGFSINIGSSPDLGGVLQGIGKTISNSVAFVQPTAKEGLPNIYCGIFTVFLAILFFFCSKIKKRERLVCGLMLGFFMLSFIIRQLDFIWHGFHFPNMLPHRFSFLYSFVLIYMAFRVFMNIDYVKTVSVIAAVCGFAIHMAIAAVYYADGGAKLSGLFSVTGGEGDPDPIVLSAFLGLVMALWVLLYTLRGRLSRPAIAICSAAIGLGSLIFIILNADAFIAPIKKNNANADSSTFIIISVLIFSLVIIATFMALVSKQLNPDGRMLKTVLGVVLLVLALFEGVISAATGVHTVSVTDGSYYPLGTDDTLSLVETVEVRERDTVDLYRTEVNKYYTLNDNALIGVDGVSMFNSMVNSRITDYMEKFGLCGWIASNRYTYQESSPFTNMMLNLKYIISPYGAYLDEDHKELVQGSGIVKLMENKYYVPMGFMVDDGLTEYNIDNLSATEPIDNQNTFFRLATGMNGDLYEYLDFEDSEAPDNAAVSETSTGRFSYSSPDSSGTYKLNYTASRDGVAVAYYDTYYSDNVSLQVNDAEVISYYVKRPFLMLIGDVKAGDKISCSASISGSSSGTITCRVAVMNEELFRQAYDKFSSSTMRASEVKDDRIVGNINAAEDGLFYTSISYIEGWKAFVDGKEVEITPVGGAMLAFKLSKGPHVIELRYTPEGFKAGLVISILAVLIFIAMVILRWKKINLLSTVSEKFRASGAYDKAYGDNTSPDNIAGSQEDADDPADPTYTMEDGPQESLPDLSESDDNES